MNFTSNNRIHNGTRGIPGIQGVQRILGIDFGTKRIGLAISNPEQTYAFPLSILKVGALKKEFDSVIDAISKLAEKESIGEIVMGESTDFKGKDNQIMEWVRLAKTALEQKGFLVHMIPEFMTSTQAERHQGKNDLLDASAAAIILQTFLDKKIHTQLDINKESVKDLD